MHWLMQRGRSHDRRREKVSERDVERHLVQAVALKGGITFKTRAIGRPGFPDRIVFLPDGAMWLIELKAKGGRLSGPQKRFAEDMRRLRQRYVCLWSVAQVDNWAMTCH